MKSPDSNGARFARLRGCMLSACLVLACSGRVDLGRAAVGSRPEPSTNEIEAAAKTTGLVKVNAIFVSGLAVDESQLYLTSLAHNESDSYYLQRCRKSDCWRSLTSIARLGWPILGIESNARQLGWVNEDGLQLCHAPDCRDVEVVQGATFQDGWSGPYVWDLDFTYWFLNSDRAIYRCSLPNCASGPESVASNAWALYITLVGDQLYWLDETYGILRTATDGTTHPEQLTLQEQTAWVPLSPEIPDTREYSVRDITLEGAFIYAALAAGDWGANGLSSTNGTPGIELARWRYAEAGAPRELVLTADPTFDSCTFMRVFDGEVVWGTGDGNLWSCLAKNCAASKRQFGVDGNVDYGRSMASDEAYIYWLSARCNANSNCGDVWNIKRTPRIPQ